MSEPVLTEIADGVATLTLHRPERLNAYTVEMGRVLFRALRELDEDDRVRAIIVTGAGRAFCAGADLEAGGATFAGDRTWDVLREDEERTLPWNMRTPVIAAINGPAIGIGATLPLRWDIRIAADTARIGFVFTRRGIIPEAGSTWLLPRIVGISTAAELMLTGRIISAADALAMQLVSRVVPAADVMTTARNIAGEIASSTSPVAVALTKRLLWRQLSEVDPARAKRAEDDVFYWIGKQADAAEGVTAFLEKRPPAWPMPKTHPGP
jgi:enoyl-CoA hydratase/carnithine racemase